MYHRISIILLRYHRSLENIRRYSLPGENKENWIAITKAEVEKGKTYYYEPNVEMTDFVSKELKKTFPVIFFVEKFSDQPIRVQISLADSAKGKRPPVQLEGVKVDKAPGGITIAELYANQDKFAGKIVKVRGSVVKYTADVMGKNWVHLQDGTSNNDKFDLTVTTSDVTARGSVVTFEGKVSLKKDFGAGYFYDVIVEDAKLVADK